MPLSWFKWSDYLHASFLAGHIRSLALDFLIELENPTAKRLFRLLEKFRCASKPPRREFSIGLFKLRDRLGMTEYRYPSKIKEKLRPALDELLLKGYLGAVEFDKARDGGTLAVFWFGPLKPRPVREGVI